MTKSFVRLFSSSAPFYRFPPPLFPRNTTSPLDPWPTALPNIKIFFSTLRFLEATLPGTLVKNISPPPCIIGFSSPLSVTISVYTPVHFLGFIPPPFPLVQISVFSLLLGHLWAPTLILVITITGLVGGISLTVALSLSTAGPPNMPF